MLTLCDFYSVPHSDSSATASMFDKALTSKTPSSLMELAAFAEKLRSRDLDMQATLMCVLAHTIASSVGIVDADLFNALTSWYVVIS